MTNLADWGDAAVLRRLAFAMMVSASAHAVVFANVTFSPAAENLGLFAGTSPPISARLAPALADTPLAGADATADAPPAPSAESLPLSAAEPPKAKAAETGGGLPSAEIYFPSSELDERAEPLNEVNFLYPVDALEAGTSGKVTLRLRIDHRGKLQQVEVVAAEPAGVFDDAALKAASGLSFRPAMRNGAPVGSVKLIEVPFDPDCRRAGTCIVGPGNPAAQP